jgi:arginyl-tRNA--protein-N-Asp/Glu arginylyltransferase
MDDAKLVGVIVAMIVERPTCARCIAARIGATKLDTLRLMRRIVGAVPAEMRTGEPCRVCGSTLAPVHVASRP